MILGKVDDKLQPMISIQLRDHTGKYKDFEVKLDTGFNGELGLPASVLNLLEKTHFETRAVRFADDRSDIVNAYYVNAMIDGEKRRMVAMDFGSGSRLLGMDALPSWTGCVEFKVNGDVTIQKPH